MSAHAGPSTDREEPSETVLAVVSSHGDQEVLLVEHDGRRLCRVRGTTRGAKEHLRALAPLLEALGAEGVRAVPRLQGEDPAGLLVERHAPLRLGGGRRRARPEDSTPPTLERHALLDAREDLEALVSALHARDWVVGLAPGAGLGARPDGTVLLADLRTLRPETSVGARMQDQHWLDSVLEDQGRTLRRRADALPRPLAASAPAAEVPGAGVRTEAAREGIAPDADSRDEPSAAGSTPVGSAPVAAAPDIAPPPAWSEGWRARLARGAAPTRDLRADDGILGPEAPERPHRRSSVRPVPGRRSLRARRRSRRTGATTRTHDHRRSMRRRGIVLALTACLLVLGGGAAALGAVLVHRDPAAPVASSAPSDGAAPGTSPMASEAAPSEASAIAAYGIEDPRGLVQELARSRHRFVIGQDATTVCAHGSPAAAQDEALRAAYQDVEVEGEGPVVTSAQVEQIDEQEGTARVRATLDQGELRLTADDGAVVVRPAMGEQEVVLDLVREDGSWRVLTAGADEA